MTLSPQLLRLMQLASPALPVGTFAYSQGLEWAAERDVRTGEAAAAWIFGIMENGMAFLDVPLLARLHRAWTDNDDDAARQWSARLLASRETAELRQEELQTGAALARLLRDLGLKRAEAWTGFPKRTFAALFALAGASWAIKTDELCSAYVYAWTENQVAAAIKLVPLGQTAGQRILSESTARIPELVKQGLSLPDSEVGGTAPGQALASALHETQRTRLFRS